MELIISINEKTLKADMIVRDGGHSIPWDAMSFSQKIEMVHNLKELHGKFVEILKEEFKQ